MEAQVEVKGTPKAKGPQRSPKVRQVQRFYELLCDCGIDEYVQDVLELRNRKISENGNKPVTAADQKTDEDIEVTEKEVIEIQMKLNLGRMMSVLAQSNRLVEFVAIVMDIDIEDAEDVTMDEFSENFTHFAAGSLRPISSLLSFGQSVG